MEIEMTTIGSNLQFVKQLVDEVIMPASDKLIGNQFFSDLRNGNLTMRRIQGYALQHTWFNRALLKGGAIRMIKASDNPRAFSDMLEGIVAEHSHPDMCQQFGMDIGLTTQDFLNVVPIHEVLCHTSVIVASSLINDCPAARRTSGLANETIVQRYSAEFYEYLQNPPYGINPEKLEFFRIHGIVDLDHAQRAGEIVASLIETRQDRERVWKAAETQVQLKLAKFEGIYNAYA
tara:strand:+ start:2863 stop:3561 length:699 start_codon:yes stop_codon:yes gene_type:complete